MRRVVFDSNAIDLIASQPGAFEALREAVDAQNLEVLFTHITVEELAEVPDPDRRALLLILLIDLGRLVPTGAAVVGYSRLNFCRLGTDDDALEAFRSGNITHTRDALIAATAQVEGCALVTHDKRLAKRAQSRDVEVLTTNALLAEFGFHVQVA